VYEPIAYRFADWISAFAEKGGVVPYDYDDSKPEYEAAIKRPLESMKPTAERSAENIRAAFNAFAALAEEVTKFYNANRGMKVKGE
jgi:hypothetical protein